MGRDVCSVDEFSIFRLFASTRDHEAMCERVRDQLNAVRAISTANTHVDMQQLSWLRLFYLACDGRAARTSSTFISIEAIKTTNLLCLLFNDFQLIDFLHSSHLREMSNEIGGYESIFRLNGRPILPPVVSVVFSENIFSASLFIWSNACV